ncbi:MAG: WSD1 family O-acyltransferase, partial [Gammaproteobacteria bacterium]|nr:WSD1 family O-acyltransferase [Gammaproteobacteria bacterium]
MNGARQVATYGLAPLVEGMGLFIATPSYNGQMTFGVTSTRDALPDIRFFMTCIEKSMADLKRAAKPVTRRNAG